jgi:tRNA (guanosine-2'-O-)-methyltransferase
MPLQQNFHLIRGEAVHTKRMNHSLSKKAETWLDAHYHPNTAAFLQHTKEQGLMVYAADADPLANPISQMQPCPNQPFVLVFGNERHGVSDVLRSGCDGLFCLPSVGLTQSYNVSAACAMTLMHLQDRGLLTPDLSVRYAMPACRASSCYVPPIGAQLLD